MGSILKQLIGRGDIPNNLHEAFQEDKKEISSRGLPVGDIATAIASILQTFVYIDECLPKDLPELLESLRDVIRESPKTKLLTGRTPVREDIRRTLPSAAVMPISPNTDDIKGYVEMEFDRDVEPEAIDGDLRADIVRITLENISDIFLLVSLNMDAILGEVTIRQRRRKLEEMRRGNGLSDVYTATLRRLKTQKGNNQYSD